MEQRATAEMQQRVATAVARALEGRQVSGREVGRRWAAGGGGLEGLVAAYVQAVEEELRRREGGATVQGVARSHRALAQALQGWREAREKEQEELVRRLRHDIGSPLSSVMGFAYLLSQEGLTEEAMREYATLLQTEASKLSDLFYAFIEAQRAGAGGRSAAAGGRTA